MTRRTIAILALVTLPSAVASIVSHLLWTSWGGERFCYEHLELDAPGLICTAGIDFLIKIVLSVLLELFVWLPMVLLLGSRWHIYSIVAVPIVVLLVSLAHIVGPPVHSAELLEYSIIPLLEAFFSLLVYRWLWPNNSFKPKPLRGSA